MAYITPDQAMLKFAPKKKTPKPGQSSAPASQDVYSFNGTVGDKQLLYVINNETKGTSKIVPADDKLFNTIGEWEGIESIENLPDAMKEWLSCYEAEIEWWQDIGESLCLEGSTSDASDSQYSEESSNPKDTQVLLSSTWHQRSPYNMLLNLAGGHWDNTGCNATAAGQILNYFCKNGYYCGCGNVEPYKFSVTGYDQNNKKRSFSVSVDVNLPSIVAFDFDNIKNSYSGSSSTISKNAVATLMLYLTTAFKSGIQAKTIIGNSDGTITYTLDFDSETGATLTNVIKALKDKLYLDVKAYTDGVKNSGKYVMGWDTSLVSHKEWGNLNDTTSMLGIIKNEIDNGSPVMLGGFRYKNIGTSSEPKKSVSGHMFICDGYDLDKLNSGKNPKIHINWGYGNSTGFKNMWFSPSALLPTQWQNKYKDFEDSSSDAYYSHEKHIIVNMQPIHNVKSIGYELLLEVLNNIGVTISNSSVFKNYNFDYDNVISLEDAEILAGYILKDKTAANLATTKDIKLASAVNTRRLCNKLVDKLSQLKRGA